MCKKVANEREKKTVHKQHRTYKKCSINLKCTCSEHTESETKDWKDSFTRTNYKSGEFPFQKCFCCCRFPSHENLMWGARLYWMVQSDQTFTRVVVVLQRSTASFPF